MARSRMILLLVIGVSLFSGRLDGQVFERLEASIFEEPCLNDSGECLDSGIKMGSIYAGYSFSFTKFHSRDSFEISQSDFVTGDQTLVSLENDFRLTPRIWVGARSASGLGFRTSYWNFNESATTFDSVAQINQSMTVVSGPANFLATISTGTAGDRVVVSSAVKAYTLDLEGTCDANLGLMQTTLGAGIRFADSNRKMEGRITPGPLGGNNSALNWSREFQGIGPVVSANGRIPLGNSGFYGSGGATLAILFGEGRFNRTQSFNGFTLPPFSPIFLLTQESDQISGISGIRFGVGRQHQTQYGLFFVEANYEGQLWTDLGSLNSSLSGFNSFSASIGIER